MLFSCYEEKPHMNAKQIQAVIFPNRSSVSQPLQMECSTNTSDFFQFSIRLPLEVSALQFVQRRAEMFYSSAEEEEDDKVLVLSKKTTSKHCVLNLFLTFKIPV